MATHPATVPVSALPAQSAPDERDRLSAIYREHFAFVWRSLRRLGAPEHGIEDACQDVFLVVARRLDEFEGRSSVQTWLFSIAMRVVRTHRRSVWRRQRKAERIVSDAPALGPGHTEPHARREAQLLLATLLDELDQDKRAAYVLIELEGMTAVEVAAEFSLNVNTVNTRLRAARQQLRAAAALHCNDSDGRP